MVSEDGYYFSLPFYSENYSLVRGGLAIPTDPFASGTKYVGAKGNWKFYAVPIGTQYHYRMRAWNTVTLSYEIWTSTGSPSPIPPSGDPVEGITIIGVWEE